MKFNAFYNGVFAKAEDIRIPLSDRSVYFGDGIYDAAIGLNGKIFMLKEHISRFFANAKALNIPIGYTDSELTELLYEVIRGSGYESYFIYFQLSRFGNERSHSYEECDRSNLLITVTKKEINENSDEVKLISAPDIRYEMCNIKTLNILPAVIASTEAKRKGADEVVFHRGTTVTECAHSNVHIIKDGELITHPTDNRILPGISRAHMLSVCKRLSIPYTERPFTTDEMYSADEVMITSTSKLIKRASEIDGKSYRKRKNSLYEAIAKTMFSDLRHFTS